MASSAHLSAEKVNAAKAADEIKVIDIGMQTLSLYLSTVAKLADDKSVDVSSSASSIGSSLKKLGPVHSDASAPANSVINLLLSAPLDVWRRESVSKLIDSANEPVQRLGMALAKFALTTALQYRTLIHESNIYYSSLESDANRQDREMLEEWHALHIADYEKAREQAQAAQTALQKIVEGQAALEAQKDKLTGAELRLHLTSYQSEVLGAMKLLSPTSSSSPLIVQPSKG